MGAQPVRVLGLLLLASLLLTLEGAICQLLHVGLLRPDPVLVLVVLLGLRGGAGSVMLVFGLGLLADSFAGTPLGLLTIGYLLDWTLIRLVHRFVLSDSRLVQAGLVFGASAVAYLTLLVFLAGMPAVGAPISSILAWTLPLALFNSLLARPIWAAGQRILGPQQRTALFAPR
jgi:cell shape-determining protein MreD